MTTIECVEIVLAALGLACMLLLIALRARSLDVEPTVSAKRVLLVDLVLLAAVFGALVDTVARVADDGGGTWLYYIAVGARGAVLFGVVALLTSYRWARGAIS